MSKHEPYFEICSPNTPLSMVQDISKGLVVPLIPEIASVRSYFGAASTLRNFYFHDGSITSEGTDSVSSFLVRLSPEAIQLYDEVRSENPRRRCFVLFQRVRRRDGHYVRYVMPGQDNEKARKASQYPSIYSGSLSTGA